MTFFYAILMLRYAAWRQKMIVNHDYPLCRIADNQHIFANKSASLDRILIF
jgi:hypothetical protein